MKTPITTALLFALGLTSTAGLTNESSVSGLPLLTVKAQPVALAFSTEALVEAVDETTVGAQVAGRVLSVHADAGSTVVKGASLLRIDAREVAESVRAAEAQHQVARLNYERHQQLKAQNFVSQAALDKAKADFDAAAANRSATQATQSHANIVAPISGVVARRHVQPGDMAMPGQALFTIYRPGALRVLATVPQHQLSAVRLAKAATVDFPELGKTVQATSIQVLPTADASTHVTSVRVNLPDLPALVPGLFARVHFLTGEAEKLSLPASVIVRRGEVAAVYVQRPDQGLSLRQLRLGETLANGEIEVLAGLTAGEQVVTDPVKAAMSLQQGKTTAAGR